MSVPYKDVEISFVSCKRWLIIARILTVHEIPDKILTVLLDSTTQVFFL